MNKLIDRRRLLQLAAGAALGTAGYSYFRGVRYTPIVWEPETIETTFDLQDITVEGKDLIQTDIPIAKSTQISLRAFAPEPSLVLQTGHATSLRLSINNISPKAELQLAEGTVSQVSETVNGITRLLEIKLESTSRLALNWKLPNPGTYKFAAIGDTGGAKELEWCIVRAKQLDADFLLHLGDFNYQQGDYHSAIRWFNQAPIPCYVSIGNHDFDDYGEGYPQFLRNIGPLNNQFSIGKTRFANIDTSLHTVPYGSGLRGQLMQKLIDERERSHTTIAFTHRPIFDPMQERDHHFGTSGEQEWLVHSLKKANTQALLSGHIHVQGQKVVDGITNYVAGQGLGHQDLITNRDYSKILLGQAEPNGQVGFEFAPLSMPMNLHCHPRSDIVKQSLSDSDHYPAIKDINFACNEQG